MIMMYDEAPNYKKNETWKEIAIHDECNIKGFFGEYKWLSNFESCDIQLSTPIAIHKFKSVENGYQAAKFNFDQWYLFENISPYEAKKLGSTKSGIVENWDNIKYIYMFTLNLQKYTKNEELKQKLIATGDKYLEETNYWNDTYWGVCNGIGENNLGKILMEIRELIKQ